jgi:hypothetical protein
MKARKRFTVLSTFARRQSMPLELEPQGLLLVRSYMSAEEYKVAFAESEPQLLLH